MFEKEAEEYYETETPMIENITGLDFQNEVIKAYQKGATFGYSEGKCKAKEILKLGLEGIKREFIMDSGGNKPFAKEALKMCNDYCEQAEQFISEVKEK